MAPGCFSHSNKEASSVSNSKSGEPSVVMGAKSDIVEIIDLDASSSTNQIPLPSTPFPYANDSNKPKDEDEEEEEEDEEEDEEEEEETRKEGKTDFLLLKKMPRLKSSVRSSNFSSIDTADTFEILEQTIIKQKRLAKLKNTDLRRKVLLKRTFDLVLEIMDAENGFNDDEPEPAQPQTPELLIPEHQGLELELHPNTCMDDDENDMEHSDEEEPKSDQTTLIKLVDSELTSARVPRQVKRRSSDSSDEDDDLESDDENEDDDEFNDQQLRLENNETAGNDELMNIYIDSVEIESSGRVGVRKSGRNERRSNHQRKRVKLTI